MTDVRVPLRASSYRLSVYTSTGTANFSGNPATLLYANNNKIQSLVFNWSFVQQILPVLNSS